MSTNTVADSRETTKEARERAEAARAKAAEREKEALEAQAKAATQPKKEKRRSSALGSITNVRRRVESTAPDRVDGDG